MTAQADVRATQNSSSILQVATVALEIPDDTNGFTKPSSSAQSNDPSAPPSYDLEMELSHSEDLI